MSVGFFGRGFLVIHRGLRIALLPLVLMAAAQIEIEASRIGLKPRVGERTAGSELESRLAKGRACFYCRR